MKPWMITVAWTASLALTLPAALLLGHALGWSQDVSNLAGVGAFGCVLAAWWVGRR